MFYLLFNAADKGKEGKPCGDSTISKDFKCHVGETALPPDPVFVSSNQANVSANMQAVAKIKELAKSGKVDDLKKLPEHPSPKLNAYLQAVIASLSPGKSQPAPAKPASSKKPSPSPAAVSGTKMATFTPAITDPKMQESIKSLATTLSSVTGMTLDEIKAAARGNVSPASPHADKFAAVVSAIHTQGLQRDNAVLHLLDGQTESDAAQAVQGIAKGNVERAVKEYRQTPVKDLQILGAINVLDTPVSGQAVCNMSSRALTMGTTSVTGDFRHELGHALHSAMSGSNWTANTPLTKAVHDEFKAVKAKVDANPAGVNQKMPHEWYETNYGVVGRRGIDNEKENIAEHYRLYHREIFRDMHEGGGGKWLAQYRQRHPGMAKIFDSWYTGALLASL